jgi:hypothetical protein
MPQVGKENASMFLKDSFCIKSLGIKIILTNELQEKNCSKFSLINKFIKDEITTTISEAFHH